MSLNKKAILVTVIVSCAVLVLLFLFLSQRKPKEEKKSYSALRAKIAEKKGVKIAKDTAPEKKAVVRKDIVLYDFEIDDRIWEIPEWALEKEDHVASSIEISRDYAKKGDASLKVNADFPGKIWAAALIEAEQYFDWGPYGRIACSIYLPEDAPRGLKVRLILTVGENWKFTEMSRAAYMIPGEWSTVSASLLPGSADWRMTTVDDEFRRDVRKIAIRVESNKRPKYAGPFYIDEVELTSD